MPDGPTSQLAAVIRGEVAPSALTPQQAKLYSHRLRLDMGQSGLVTFQPSDVADYLDEAFLLVTAGLLEKSADQTSMWRNSIKRAAEIFEWTSQSSIRPAGAPLHLLSAAAFQLSGYPAMAQGHLKSLPRDEDSSAILECFLRGDFPAVQEEIASYWANRAGASKTSASSEDLSAHTFRHVIMCIGVIAAYFRTGDDTRLERATSKLIELSRGLVHSRDEFSGVLARLTAEVGISFSEAAIWPYIRDLSDVSDRSVASALVQFARSAYLNRRSLVWSGQAVGFARLSTGASFVLCTPTGSGKTTVATVAIIQDLFAEPASEDLGFANLAPGNLVLYLVPSRALAAEVEGRLAQDLRGIVADPVVVTGLYGGTDWGPTDAWIASDRATIVICTFEKADALVRYLGVIFLNRVKLVVIDEAHMVEQNMGRLSELQEGASRAYRLEQLGCRILRAQDTYGFRVVALSAVAAKAAPAIARWVGKSHDAKPALSSHRSTRQMLGRLEVSADGGFAIRYELMDGNSLSFPDQRADEAPYVRAPFPPYPGGRNDGEGVEVRMRGPTLWAALHLAAVRPDGTKPSVLISLTDNIEGFCKTCIELLDAWPASILPDFWTASDEEVWTRCLASVADYFTVNSLEYRLLEKGIAVHHGKMPGLLARRLKIVIDRGIVRIIIATSTLSEGVNIPVNTVLMPSVVRSAKPMSVQEFSNLVGRAGRPGVSSEGSALVVLPAERLTYPSRGRIVDRNRQWGAYAALINELRSLTSSEHPTDDEATSPLTQLLLRLKEAWSAISSSESEDEFWLWLETAAVVDEVTEPTEAAALLDTFDAFLIAAVQEIEELNNSAMSPADVEIELARLWRRTYSYAAAQTEERLQAIWMRRGRVIKSLYPDAVQRRHIYKTSLGPKAATSLLLMSERIRDLLSTGLTYRDLGQEGQLAYIQTILSSLSAIKPFRISTDLGKRESFTDWPTLLRWWLAKNTLKAQPVPSDITKWFDFVAKNFVYRGAWGLGSVIGVLMDKTVDGTPVRALELEDWPRSGLPWAAFWLKELLTWGTLEPVAAFLLARGDAIDRVQAEDDAKLYYSSLAPEIDANEALDPRRIGTWVSGRRVSGSRSKSVRTLQFSVALEREPRNFLEERLSVTAIVSRDKLTWVDPAGHAVATSNIPADWPEMPARYGFDLLVDRKMIVGELYQPHV